MGQIDKPVNLTNDPRVKVERETHVFNGSEEDKLKKFYLDEALKACAPPMCEPIGTIGIHIYRRPSDNSLFVSSQFQASEVEEQVVALAIQQAMYSLMEKFGHERPKGIK